MLRDFYAEERAERVCVWLEVKVHRPLSTHSQTANSHLEGKAVEVHQNAP